MIDYNENENLTFENLPDMRFYPKENKKDFISVPMDESDEVGAQGKLEYTYSGIIKFLEENSSAYKREFIDKTQSEDDDEPEPEKKPLLDENGEEIELEDLDEVDEQEYLNTPHELRSSSDDDSSDEENLTKSYVSDL